MLSESETNPKEVKFGRLKWLDRYIYKSIGSIQTDLNSAERRMLVDQLAIALRRYETLILGMKDVRNELYRQYTEAVIDKKATSQFSRNFNMSVKGLNDQLGEQIDTAFKAAFEYEKQDKSMEAAVTLQLVELNHKILFSDGVIDIIKNSNTAATHEFIRINQYREKLFSSILKMVVGIARRHGERLNGSIIEWSDLVQEAVIATIYAVESYHPIADGKTFTSYIYVYVNGVISKRISEATRTIVVPRTIVDRFTCVQQAMDKLGILESDVAGGVWIDQKLINGRVKYETLKNIAIEANKLRSMNKSKYTPEEVENLLIISREEISLDQEVGDPFNEASLMTLSEVLKDDVLNLEEQLDGKYLKPRLMNLIRQYTNDEEYTIMNLRYGFNVVPGFKTVAAQYIELTGKPMNKTKAAFIEQTVLDKIQNFMRLDPNLARYFKELSETLVFVDDQ